MMVNSAIIEGTKYRNVLAVLETPEDVTQEELAPMCSKSIPSTTESATIPLRSKDRDDLFAIVDPEDFSRLNKYKWYPRMAGGDKCHARRGYRDGDTVVTVYMHTDVIGAPPEGMVIDHINGNPLDNRKSNLRFATHQQNHWNSKKTKGTEYQGVSFVKQIGLWQARIRVKGVYIHLGYHRSAEDAARAYDYVASRLQGEFAFLNFPEEKGR